MDSCVSLYAPANPDELRRECPRRFVFCHLDQLDLSCRVPIVCALRANPKGAPDTNVGAVVYLKKVVTVGPVEFTREHTAPLEIYGQIRRGTDRRDRVSP